MNIHNQAILIRDEILSGTFDSDGYQHCKFIFDNCKFVNFDFDSSCNAVELSKGNVFYENVHFNALALKIKSEINCVNLNVLSLSGEKVEIMPELSITAYNGISIYSRQNLNLSKMHLSSSVIDIQSTYGTTRLNACKIYAEQGCKITNTQGNLEMMQCKIHIPKASLDDDGKKISGVILQCFSQNGILKLDKVKIKTDVLEIYHPSRIYNENVVLIKETDTGRLSIHGNKTICYHYIEPELELSKFLKNTVELKSTNQTSKIKQLLKFIS